MEILFLGTGSMAPTKERNHNGILLRHGSEGILLDCGEGTQRQLKIAGIRPNQISKILITHWHGDHSLGLPGLVQTLGMSEYNRNLRIFGPKGTKEKIELLKRVFIAEERLKYDVEDIDKKRFYDGEDFYLEALPLEHGTSCLGYSFVEKEKRKMKTDVIKKLGIPEGPLIGKLQRGESIHFNGKTIKPDDVSSIVKGRKVTFIADTLPCRNAVVLAENSDLLICEATYAHELEEKAREYRHMTARQAALIASQSGAKKLVLTHFSPRYKTTEKIEEDARDVFDNAICAKDFMKIKL